MIWARGLHPTVPNWFLRFYCEGMGIPTRKERYYIGQVVTDGYGIWRFRGDGWEQVILLGGGHDASS